MRVYAALLHLYPRSFRAEYGDELLAVFRARTRDAMGPRARVVLWLDILTDTIASATAVAGAGARSRAATCAPPASAPRTTARPNCPNPPVTATTLPCNVIIWSFSETAGAQLLDSRQPIPATM